MSIEQQVPTIETCQKLEETGIKFDSYFVWNDFGGWHVEPKKDLDAYTIERPTYQAPTVQELLTTIPKLRATISRIGEEWWMEYINYTIKGDNLAEVLADLVLKIKYC